MSMHLAFGEKYDITTLIPIRKISLLERTLLRMSVPLHIFKVMKKNMFLKTLKNPLHDGKRTLTGNKLLATSSDFMLSDIKIAAKKLKVTINDLVTASLATAVKEYFEMKGDTKTDKINIVIPANIRFKHYETVEQIRIENKFAPISLTIPLEKTMEKSLEKVPKVTASLRSSFAEIYATYALSFYSTLFMPHWVLNWFIGHATLPYTLAFSNTPGPLKPVVDRGKKSIKMVGYILPSGYTGIGISCLSYIDSFRITMSVDDSIMKDPQVLVDLIEKNLRSCFDTGS
jgi:hypothetical protein